MAITLAELAKIETNPLRKYVLMNLLRESDLMRLIPWENVSSLQSVAVRWRNLPNDTPFRQINGGYNVSAGGDYEQVWESVYGFGGDIVFDRVLQKLQNTIVDPVEDRTKMFLKSKVYQFNDYFVNGDHATDADGFEGIKKRIGLMPSRQTVAFHATALDPTADAASARAFVDKFDEAWYKCNSGKINAILMNEGLLYGFVRPLRYISAAGGSFLDVSQDNFGRQVLSYRGIPFVDAGFKVDQTTEILPVTEASDTCSVYFVSFGIDEGITGIQLGSMDVYDPLNGGELESKPSKMKRLDWFIGLAGFGSYGLVRGTAIKNPATWT